MDETTTQPGKVRYLVYTWVPEDLLEGWNTWHNEEHVSTIVATPQMRSARKYRVTDSSFPGAWQPQYVTVYELDIIADFEAYMAGPGMGLRAEYEERYGAVGKIARMILHEEVRFDPVTS
jgi:hypothetical protein